MSFKRPDHSNYASITTELFRSPTSGELNDVEKKIEEARQYIQATKDKYAAQQKEERNAQQLRPSDLISEDDHAEGDAAAGAEKLGKQSDFLNNITISRDQTKGRKNIEESKGLQAVLEKKLSFSPFALARALGIQIRDPNRNSTKRPSSRTEPVESTGQSDDSGFESGSETGDRKINRKKGLETRLSVSSAVARSVGLGKLSQKRDHSPPSSESETYSSDMTENQRRDAAESLERSHTWRAPPLPRDGDDGDTAVIYERRSARPIGSGTRIRPSVSERKDYGSHYVEQSTRYYDDDDEGDYGEWSIRRPAKPTKPGRPKPLVRYEAKTSLRRNIGEDGVDFSSPEEEIPEDKEEIESRIRKLTLELDLLKGKLGEPSEQNELNLRHFTTNRNNFGDDNRNAPWRVVYRIKNKPYLGAPQWQHASQGIRLVATMPIRDMDKFIERHPEMLFIIFKTYSSQAERLPESAEFGDEDDLSGFPAPAPTSETIWFASSDMVRAMEEFSENFQDFETVFPRINFTEELNAPYLCLFHMFPEGQNKVQELDEPDQERIRTLYEYLKETHLPLYEDVLNKRAAGKVRPSHMPFLVKPGDVVVRAGPVPKAFMVESWPRVWERWITDEDVKQRGKPKQTSRQREVIQISHTRSDRASRANFYGERESSNSSSEEDAPKRRSASFERASVRSKHRAANGNISATDAEADVEVWGVTGWNWDVIDGRLFRNYESLEFRIDPNATEDIDVTALGCVPFQFASDDVKELLLRRGQNFWRCRDRQFVGYTYHGDENDDIESVNERFMVDFSMYRRLHPESKKQARALRRKGERDGDKDIDVAIPDTLPDDATINLFPSNLIGYNLRQKKWMDIEVDRIQEVNWNKKAFESLVVDEETKHLVKALISNQLKSEKSTDLIAGKGNGLLILLHGGPGTGKTFTAESVAEMAEKPLYRVTCGDIGTKPEEVEKYLESVLLLGKTWGCVVLLDEADVFLEERSLTNLERNALVSVFLRVLEYYDGILILTSNRVGTFDQAFKSRIQLALHYENLTKPQRRKIWRNFFNRLKDLGETQVDYDDLHDHIDELAKEELNGRQIRNAITTARQLANFDGKKFSYEQLQHVIKVAGKFETYLQGVKQGFSDDQLARDDMIR